MRRRYYKKGLGRVVAFALGTALLTGCTAGNSGGGSVSEQSDDTAKDTVAEAETGGDNMGSIAETDIKKGVYKNAVCCHDPQIILGDDGTYYMTGSHQILAKSEDLKDWSYIGNGNNVFSNLFSGDLDAFRYVGKNDQGGYSVWAANTYYNETVQKYVMYFCTTSSFIKSNLCMAVSDSAGGPFEYTDTFLYSGFSKTQAEETNIYEVLGADADISKYLKYGGYDNEKWPNCIDPAVFTDADNRMWMVYGSWSGGIFLLELDPATGLPIHEAREGDAEADNYDPYYGYRLVGGGHHAIEGPYLTYSPESGYYHLFLSYGELTSNGGYQIRQFRSKNPMGPYVDAQGQELGNEENYMSYGLKMMGNYTLPSLSVTYMAPGGQSIFQDPEGNYYITYHQRFDDGAEFHEPRVHRLFLNDEGWFTASAFEYTGDETLFDSVTDLSELNGTVYVLDHGIDVNDIVNKPVECTLADGVLTGEGLEGTVNLTKEGSYVHITVNGEDYSGVLMEMTDEAGNKTRTVSAVGANNHTIWMIQYIE